MSRSQTMPQPLFNLSALLTRCLLPLLILGLTGCNNPSDAIESNQSPAANPESSTAIFAAGCFWCVEEAFDKVPGVIETTSGYIGGSTKNPTYKQVTSGKTGHTEALRVKFDPALVSYTEMLNVFWRNVDPTDTSGQFCDRGSQYRSGIFFLDGMQKQAAVASKQALMDDPKAPAPIVTEITAATTFYTAEGYHQNYHNENPLRYRYYKAACGRADRLEALWGKQHPR